MPVVDKHVSAPFGAWNALLQQFGAMMDDYCEVSRRAGESNEVPYWYGERTITGLLTAASWKIGGQGLDESAAARGPVRRTKKRAPTNPTNRRKTRQGRIDSYVILRGVWYQLEAKLRWVSDRQKLEGVVRGVRHQLELAGGQLDTPTPEYQGDHALALCYVVPELTWPSKEDWPPASTLLMEIAKSFHSVAIRAIYQPPKGTMPWLTRPNRRHYPGLLLVGEKWW